MSRESKRDPYANEPVEISAVVYQTTEKAILVSEDGKEKQWLPKSQIDNQDWQIGKVHEITVPKWLANAKGFKY